MVPTLYSLDVQSLTNRAEPHPQKAEFFLTDLRSGIHFLRMNTVTNNQLPHLLVIDDEEGMRLSLKQLLEGNQFTVSTASSAKEGLQVLQRCKIDLIICDIVMPDMSGLLFLSKIGRTIPVIMMTAFASIETTRKAFKSGACDYLVKPFDFDELLVVIAQNLQPHAAQFTSEKRGRWLSSNNRQYRKILELAEKFSVTDMPILITGESGTGKEVIATYIYETSHRVERPFIRINCAAIPETLLESELFGYEKGAFTGASNKKIGKFDEADGGTLFLDEIGDMPLQLQAKMLRVLQDFAFYRLGGQQTISVDTRIIAASNQNLDELIAQKRFREDLYHRLNGVHLRIPALRERPEDFDDFVHNFVTYYARKYQKPVTTITEETLQTLRNYGWPGNIRELMNSLERAIVVCEGQRLLPEHLPDRIKATEEDRFIEAVRPENFPPRDDRRIAFLRKVILEALTKTNGNRHEAAQLLNISRKTLYNRMKELDITYEFK
jgi:DNA-binding NtrC family response regulator